MHTTPREKGFDGFGPFAFACKARDLTAQLDALKQRPAGRIPANAQDVDAAQVDTYTPGLSKAVL